MIETKIIYPPSNLEYFKGITVRHKINKIGKYIRQSSSRDSFAWIDFDITPINNRNIIEFTNYNNVEVIAHHKFRSSEDIKQFNKAIYNVIIEFVQNHFEQNNETVSNLSIAVNKILVNFYDSSPMNYRIATYLALRDIFADESNALRF